MLKMENNLNNYAVRYIFGSLETHSLRSCHVALSPSARGIEYPFSSSELAVPLPNFASQNSTKLNIKRNFGFCSKAMRN